MSSHVYEVSTVAPTEQSARALAKSAIEARLAAGGQVIGPLGSFFWHLGEYGEGEEWKVTFKTTANRYAALEAHLVEHHEWDNPEVSAVMLAAASAPYADWVARVTSDEVSESG